MATARRCSASTCRWRSTATCTSARPDNLLRTILDGVREPASRDIGFMPAFREALDDAQIAELAGYMRARFAPQAPAWTDLPERGAPAGRVPDALRVRSGTQRPNHRPAGDPRMTSMLSPAQSLPRDAERATLVGRLWQPDIGPVLVAVHEGGLHDLSRVAATASQLLELDDPARRGAPGPARRAHAARRVARAGAGQQRRDPRATRSMPWLLAPCDLQAIKAGGVTFVASLLERVIEEQARGDAGQGRSGARARSAA